MFAVKSISIFLFATVCRKTLQNRSFHDETLFEGDIMGLDGDTIQMSIADQNRPRAVRRGSTLREGIAIVMPSAKWPDGKVYYEISDDFNDMEAGIIKMAFESFHRHTCIKLIERSNQSNYIVLVKGLGCASYVGRKCGMQLLSLDSECFSENAEGLITHEIMHAIGFYHEHTRWDRDEYIDILWHNIDNSTTRNAWNNFQKYGLNVLKDLNTKYDYDSIMHYGTAFFGINGRNTIIPKKAGVEIGQREGLSKTDIQEINRFYNCSNVWNENSNETDFRAHAFFDLC